MHKNRTLALKQKTNVDFTFIMLRLFHDYLQNSKSQSYIISFGTTLFYFQFILFGMDFDSKSILKNFY
jgi:hypothetical protein